MSLAPIILFVYNRPEHTRRTVEALAKNDMAKDSELYIYCDGPKENASIETLQKIREAREYVSTISGFKDIHIVCQPKNKGLDPSEIDAVTEIVNRYGKVIVVEDDLITHRYFLRFMNEALNFYEYDKRIYTVSGYTDAIEFPESYQDDVFASYRCESWGWGTWADRWAQNDWNEQHYRIVQHPTRRQIRRFNRAGEDFYPMLLDKVHGRTDAWDIRWGHTLYLHDGLCVRPIRSLLYNIGFDGTGVHSGNMTQECVLAQTAALYDSDAYMIKLVSHINIDRSIQKAINRFFKVSHESWYTIIKRKIKQYFNLLFGNRYDKLRANRD